MDIMDTIKQQIAENTVILYMKGSPNAPQCGFSMRSAKAIMEYGLPKLEQPAQPDDATEHINALG